MCKPAITSLPPNAFRLTGPSTPTTECRNVPMFQETSYDMKANTISNTRPHILDSTVSIAMSMIQNLSTIRVSSHKRACQLRIWNVKARTLHDRQDLSCRCWSAGIQDRRSLDVQQATILRGTDKPTASPSHSLFYSKHETHIQDHPMHLQQALGHPVLHWCLHRGATVLLSSFLSRTDTDTAQQSEFRTRYTEKRMQQLQQ